MFIGVGLLLTGRGQPAFYPDASLALDFTIGAYRVGTGGSASPDFTSLPGLTVTRASTGYAQTSSGTLVSFGSNVARITDKGLLGEQAATNLALRTTDQSSGYSSGFGTVGLTAAQADPAGGAGAVQLAATGNWLYATTVISGITGGATYTGSWYLKASAPATVNVQLYDGTTITNAVANVTTSWQRFTATATIAAGATSVRLGVGQTSSATVTAAFPQLETGAFATSYIPTTSASATRAADVVSIGSLSLAQPFTLVAQGSFPETIAPPATARMATLSDGTNVFNVGINSAGKGEVNGSGLTATAFGSAITLGSTLSVAANLTGNASRASVNASAAGAVTGASTLGTSTTLYLGALAAAANPMNGYLRKVVIYPTAFSDAQLQAASA